MTVNNANQQFDFAILSDKEINVIKTSEFPESEIAFTSNTGILYKTEVMLSSNKLKAILDNPRHTEAAKIQFIKDALADTTKDAFQYINNRAIDFWRSSVEAKKIITNYFSEKQFEHSADPEIKYKHFEFITKSLFPEAAQLIADYFSTRQQVPIKYRQEMDLLIRLKLMGKEEDAVKYLTIIVDDIIHNRLIYVDYGSRSVELTHGYVFDHLCLSENEAIAGKATDILFNLLYQKKDVANRHQFYDILKHVDKERFYQVLDKWYAFYAGLDLSVIDLDELKTEGWYAASQKVAGAGGYDSFMSLYAAYFGEKYGKKFWKDFISKAAYIQHRNNSFENQQMWTIENVLQNKSVTTEDLKEMLFQVIKTPDLFRHDNKTRYLRLILKAYPDKKIPQTDYDKLQLEKIYAYAFPLNIPEEDLRLPTYWQKELNEEKITELVSAINEFARENDLSGISLNKKQTFLLKLEGNVQSIIINFLIANNLMTGFDAESADTPVNYIKLFNTEFRKVLANKHYENFIVSQLTKKINETEYQYSAFLKYHNSIYKIEYTDQGGDYYDAQKLVKMINLCLIDNKEKDRLIEIKTGDQGYLFILMEPEKAKPFLDKYKIRSQALNYNDAFANMNNK